MKYLPSQLAYLPSDREAHGNLRALLRYLAFLMALVALYALVFHVIKQTVEHEEHSWVPSFAWLHCRVPCRNSSACGACRDPLARGRQFMDRMA